MIRPLAAGLIVAAAILAALVPRGSSSPPERTGRLPEPPAAAFSVGAPVPLARHRDETTWAAVRRDVRACARPSRSARAVGVLHARTPEATTNIVLVLARRGLWIRTGPAAATSASTAPIART